uniref:Peptidyl-prolyl cis-trans isomerase n=1 Tax=Guillardia theta TaxID=55529 RepID=A0PCZ5_GUITH|nr:rotamase [Guillardia theta]
MAAMRAVALLLVGMAVMAEGSKQKLLQEELEDAVLTNTGSKIATSKLYRTGEPVGDFPQPSDPRMNLKSPKKWQATFATNVGSFNVIVHRDWSPKGADRFYSLVMNDFYDGARFFRYADNFVVQWGLKGTPQIDSLYENGANIMDDPQFKSNTKGRITFATSGPNTRSTQVFVNLADNTFLDSQGFTPFGELASEDDLNIFMRKINAEYGEKANQNKIIHEGNQLYLNSHFSHMSYIKSEKVQFLEE